MYGLSQISETERSYWQTPELLLDFCSGRAVEAFMKVPAHKKTSPVLRARFSLSFDSAELTG